MTFFNSTIAGSKLPFISIALASSLLLLYTTRKHRKTERELLPGEIPIPVPDPCLPLIGHLLSVGSSPILQVTKWQEQLGPLIRLKMGVQNWVFIGDPFIAHDIYMVNGAKTSGRPLGSYGSDIYAMKGRGIVFATNDKKWKNTRTAVLTILAQNKVDEYGDELRFEAESLIDGLTQDGEDIDPMEKVHCAAYNCIMRTAFATRAESSDDSVFQEILHLIDVGGKYAGSFGYLSIYLPWMAWYDWITRKTPSMKHFIRTYRDDVFKKLTDNALKQDQDCMAKNLYKLKDEFGLDDLDIMVTLSDLIIAGTDTISVTTRWAIAILANHTETQELIIKELDDFIRTHNRLPTFADRDHLPYMISVQRECLRYRPTVPFNVPHMATEDFDYKGYHFSKGDIIISNIYYLHKTPIAYDKADSFVPDRFIHQSNRTMMGSAAGNIHQRDHYNFGWGRRICPGTYLAETQLFNIYVKLFSQHKILPASDGTLPDLENFVDNGIVVAPVDYTVRFAKRDDAVALM